MFLRQIAIRNFRALDEVYAEFDRPVNVIVGPNASGKTTVLEAIRLTKALLAPRTPNEPNQALIAIGAASPHLPQRIISDAIARDPSRPTTIRTIYRLSDNEIGQIEAPVQQIATNIVQAQVGQQFSNQVSLIGYLSSPPGAQALQQAQLGVQNRLAELRHSRDCRLELTIDFASGRLSGSDPIGQAFFSFLDQQNPPSVSLFSYFPADRALPIGEQPVQLGGADAGNQLESHNSQPQLKYARLKNVIFNAVVAGDEERRKLDEEFRKIFEHVLKGREFESVGINPIGLLSIKIRDVETGRVFDLDGMSSGEKGLILTSLVIARSVKDGGIVLLDEPELHLNPAVCKDLLRFYTEIHAIPRSLQMFMCSHSVDLLNAIFDRDECALYHLSDEAPLSRVHQQDREEISEALYRLGTSEAEGLLYKAAVFLEGEHDIELLEAGFSGLVRRYNLRELGGRGEVERHIQRLQDAERRGQNVPISYFIFDHDRRPASLASTERVKIYQWERYCLENYLLDVDLIADLLMQDDVAKVPVPHRAEITRLMTNLWENQLNDFVVKEVYNAHGFESPGLRASEVTGRDFDQAAITLFDRLDKIRASVERLERNSWVSEFITKCAKRKNELHPIWEREWQSLCDGKRLLRDIHSQIPLRMSLVNFKKRMILEMSAQRRQSWNEMERLLSTFLQLPQSISASA